MADDNIFIFSPDRAHLPATGIAIRALDIERDLFRSVDLVQLDRASLLRWLSIPKRCGFTLLHLCAFTRRVFEQDELEQMADWLSSRHEQTIDAILTMLGHAELTDTEKQPRDPAQRPN